MFTSMKPATPLSRIVNGLLIVVLLGVLAVRVFGQPAEVQPDSRRYMHMGLNMADHGVLTGQKYSPDRAPEPGLGYGGPMTALELGLALRLDDTTKQTFLCFISEETPGGCDLDVPSLQGLYVLELFVFHMAVWFIARRVFGRDIMAWGAVGFSLVFKETSEYAHSVLTEPLYMMGAGVFFIVWVLAVSSPGRSRTWFTCGLALGGVTLIKPAWIALMPVLVILAALYVLWDRSAAKAVAARGGAFAGGVVLVSAALLARNVIQLDFWGLSDPSYMATSLAHRFAFNDMDWTQWLAAWIYYLPDFGDNLARSVFGADVTSPLAWGPDSFYVYGRDTLITIAAGNAEGKSTAAYLVERHFFDDPVKGIMVTLVLAWRGVFVGGWPGLIAVVAAAPVLYFAPSRQRNLILLVALPAVLMVGAHALVSVSLTRYNIPMVIPYSLILTMVLRYLILGVGRAVPSGLVARAKTFLPKSR